MKIAIQGIPGSFHHQVALDYFGQEAEIVGYRIFEEVAKSVANQEVQYGVMAIENSIAGAILPNYDLIDRNGLSIKDEYYLPISHNLLALPGQSIQDIKEVKSHPMAILQCKGFFEQYPGIQLTDDVDTASVAKRISEENLLGTAAIASKTAASIYKLTTLKEDIQTIRDNFTRFIVLQKFTTEPDFIPNKASLKITVKNEKGVLAKLLTLMSDFGLDLSKIQSIPVIEKPWEYAFFIDTQFEDYTAYRKAIAAIDKGFGSVKIFGEYLNRK
ncbi:prephenate dehydratase [Pararhodonellum marinum]|uniref:prephenate dehydratase n=1 Tax=Pararhodonellum marinum TaxID=2755358 RepID=UPI001890224A|nr:prephenate dehydratase [Pararhodonellum marinum]